MSLRYGTVDVKHINSLCANVLHKKSRLLLSTKVFFNYLYESYYLYKILGEQIFFFTWLLHILESNLWLKSIVIFGAQSPTDECISVWNMGIFPFFFFAALMEQLNWTIGPENFPCFYFLLCIQNVKFNQLNRIPAVALMMKILAKSMNSNPRGT